MANSSARPFCTNAAAATSPTAAEPFDISAVLTPPKRLLSEDQLGNCKEAIEFFDEKLKSRIDTEFEILKKDAAKTILERYTTCSIALNAENFDKNRYDDVVPYDGKSVMLNQHESNKSSSTGYINASFVKTSESVSQFIASQGPLPDTSEDFWAMIIQEHCPVIIMLTRLFDDGEETKCADYLQAEDGPPKFGNVCIATTGIEAEDTSLTLRRVEVKNKEIEKPFPVLHIQYPNWPDHEAPKDTAVVREIFRRVSAVPPSLGPIVVHCSAGVGRTGTYCVIHNTIQRILTGDMTALNLFDTVMTFRSQRMRLVQTEDQYVFCHRAILDELKELVAETKVNGD